MTTSFDVLTFKCETKICFLKPPHFFCFATTTNEANVSHKSEYFLFYLEKIPFYKIVIFTNILTQDVILHVKH